MAVRQPFLPSTQKPFFVNQGGAQGSSNGFGPSSRPETGDLVPRSILKSSSLPALAERPNSSMLMSSGIGLPPGAASFQQSAENAGLRATGYGLPSVTNQWTEPNRPGTTQCNSWLESSMGFRIGKPLGSPARTGGFKGGPGAMSATQISVHSPMSGATIGFNNCPSVSSGLEQWPARTAARARMGSLAHFTGTPPRPISRERKQNLPLMSFIGIHGGQVRHPADWHYKGFGHTQDKRIRHDHVAGDLGRA